MEEWEFLRRPARARKEEDKSRVVCVNVTFGGTNREFLLDEGSTFESVYEEYENRFPGHSVVLQSKDALVSKYAKIKSMLPSSDSSVLSLHVELKEEESRKQRRTEYYRIRYTPDKYIDVNITDEVSIRDLLKKSVEIIQKKEETTLPPCVFVFNGDVLPLEEKIEEILVNEDLLDLLPEE